MTRCDHSGDSTYGPDDDLWRRLGLLLTSDLATNDLRVAVLRAAAQVPTVSVGSVPNEAGVVRVSAGRRGYVDSIDVTTDGVVLGTSTVRTQAVDGLPAGAVVARTRVDRQVVAASAVPTAPPSGVAAS